MDEAHGQDKNKAGVNFSAHEDTRRFTHRVKSGI
jgi:hypothetical protein